MPTAVKPADCFSIKRLVRDYGKTSSDVCFGKLSMAGNVSVEDVFIRIANPHTYRLDIVKSLFLKRADFTIVKMKLMAMIRSFEVIPAAYIYPNSHRKS